MSDMRDWKPRKTSDNRREWSVSRLSDNPEIEVDVEYDDVGVQYVWLSREDLVEMLKALGPE